MKIKNWQDIPDSDLNKAKKLLADRNNKVNYLSEITGIDYHVLTNYRYNLDSLDNASGERINKLAQFYDYLNYEKLSDKEKFETEQEIGSLINKVESQFNLSLNEQAILDKAREYLLVDNRYEVISALDKTFKENKIAEEKKVQKNL